MISFLQITKPEEILKLSDYYILDMISPDEPYSSTGANVSLSLLQISRYAVTRESSIQFSYKSISAEEASASSVYPSGRIASSLANLLFNSPVIAEPSSLNSLRFLFEKHGYEGTILFLPVSKLVPALFPTVVPGSISELAGQLHIPDPDTDPSLITVYQINALLRRCQVALGGQLPVIETPEDSSPDESPAAEKKKTPRKKISNKTLKRWADTIWSVSPLFLILSAIIIVFFVFLLIPHGKEEPIDRNQAPINYLVLSWDKTGKYGLQPKAKNGLSSPIQFRIPYGVYNVLNNNSIPVELNIVTEGKESNDHSDSDDNSEAVDLSAKNASPAPDEEEEDTGPSKVTLRPNSSRQITVDTDQYVTLSEDASELIFFYLSEVPEEKESDTMGHDSGSHAVVYAYVKGTEVRFRKAPSLEGQVLNSLNNGQQVQVLGVTGEWTHVSVQDQKGYIFSQYLTSEDPQAAALAAAKAEAVEENSTEDQQAVQDEPQNSDQNLDSEPVESVADPESPEQTTGQDS